LTLEVAYINFEKPRGAILCDAMTRICITYN